MNCSETQPLIGPHFDRELDAASGERVDRHLAGCADCATTRDQLALLRAAAQDLREPASPALGSLIRASLRVDLEARRSRSLTLWRRLAVAACLVAALSATWGVLNRPMNSGTSALATEAVAGHVRSLMAEHLVDVVSSDQHTVKPWFTGKIDFSPDVHDFAEQGFPLVGGRMDYLNGRSVVALVYRRQKHVINAFTWPATAADDPRESSETHAGYHILRWREGAMNWCLVSDASDQALQELRRLIEQQAAPTSEPSR